MEYQIQHCLNSEVNDYVILSSGLGGHAHFWQPQISELQQKFNVLSYDQEGCHKDSKILAENYSIQDMADQVLRILKKQHIQSCHFIGHALGGHIGAELAVMMKNEHMQLKSLTSINAWDELDPHTQKCFETRIALLKHVGASAYVSAQALFLYPPAWISQHYDELIHAENHQLDNFPPIENVLTRIRALQKFRIEKKHIDALKNTRIHLIANQDDFLVPVQKSTDLKNKLAHAKLSVFNRGAHASTVTQSDEINTAMMKFFAE